MPALLARRYAEPVEVTRRDDAPAGFIRRGRSYRVCAVLDHWLLTGSWWQPARTGAGVGIDDEREFWRVEAVTRRPDAVPAVVELCFAASTGVWAVCRVFD